MDTTVWKTIFEDTDGMDVEVSFFTYDNSFMRERTTAQRQHVYLPTQLERPARCFDQSS